MNQAAGALIYSKSTEKFLLLQRSENQKWALVGGSIDDGETTIQGLRREILEEISYNSKDDIHHIFTYYGKEYFYESYLIIVDNEIPIKLNYEHISYGWFEYKYWPAPLHFGMNSLRTNQFAQRKIWRTIKNHKEQ